jgi:predicted secreted protein
MKSQKCRYIQVSLLILLTSACSTEIPMIEQPLIKSNQILNQPMPSQLTPVVLPNSGLQRIRSVVGQKHIIQISSNPSTGYQWEMEYEEPTKNCFNVLSKNMVYDDKESYSGGVRKVGSPGKQEWQFQTNCSGNYRVTFVYKRPWGQGPPLYKTVAEFITAKE